MRMKFLPAPAAHLKDAVDVRAPPLVLRSPDTESPCSAQEPLLSARARGLPQTAAHSPGAEPGLQALRRKSLNLRGPRFSHVITMWSRGFEL